MEKIAFKPKELTYSLSNSEMALKTLKAHPLDSISDEEIKKLLQKCLKMLSKNYNSLLPHLNIKLSTAVKLHWAMNSILKRNFSRLEIYNQVINPHKRHGKRRDASESSEMSDDIKLTPSKHIPLDSWKFKLKYAQKILTLSGNKPLVISGGIASGKHSFIHTFQDLFFPKQRIVTIHLDDQTDVKNLLGTYYVAETDILYKKGPLTIAAEEGWWVLLKGVEKAPDILSGVRIDSGYLHVISGQKVKCKGSFRILATSTGNTVFQDCEVITLEDLKRADIEQICKERFTSIWNSDGLISKILNSIELLGKSDLNRHLLDKKNVYVHDIIRVLNRVNELLKR